MPDPEIATAEADIWAALQVVEYDSEGAPIDPPDAAFIRSLIAAAEDRIARFCGVAPIDMDEIPPNLSAAIRLDVLTAYFQRFNPEPPAEWDALIAPNRVWGFGGSVDDEA